MTDNHRSDHACGCCSRRLTVAQLCDRLQVKVDTVYQWNRRGTGPKFIRVGRHLRYRVSDVDAWEKEHESGAA